MGSEADLYEPYQAALKEDWESFKDFYKKHDTWMSYPATASMDNAFHLAAFSKEKEPLQSLLEISEKEPLMRYHYLEKNAYGNTALHEAAANGNLKAAEALVYHHSKLLEEDNITDPEDELLEAENIKGETPLFMAASFGSIEVVKFLSSIEMTRFIEKEGEPKKEVYFRLKDIHRRNIGSINVEPKPDASNQQSVAIQGEKISKPKPNFSNQLSGTIRGEKILELKPDASNQLSSVIQSEIKLEPKPDSSTQLSSVIEGAIKLVPKPDASTQLSGTIRSKIISEPKPCATQEKKPDASILHAAITGHHFETALYLLKMDDSLATLKDLNGRSSLHLLATMPSAFESGYRWGTWIHRVFYYCLPLNPIGVAADNKKATSNISKGLPNSDNQNATTCLISCCSNSGNQNATSCLIACFSKGWLILLEKLCALARSNILEEKRKHKFALELAERLVEKDSSWEETINTQVAPESQVDEDQYSKENYKPIPLFLATERGIVEIVHKILEKHPQLVEHKNDLGQTILHVAIKHRQFGIFNYVRSMKIPMTRLVRKVDKNGYTILHHAADMEPRSKKIHPAGPVYQLQDELKWYKRVNEITHAQYAMLCDKKENMTCEELFNLRHQELLEKAQGWIKETSQSCSAVAVLVATVVFAAAYTVPGGSNEKGYPIFLKSSLFLLFTVMDVFALASSLTSVVMFLSVLTSPYTYDEFLHNLPKKLTIGFSLLFVSLATTMIAFAATLLLIVRSEKPQWTTTLIYTAAFFPVSIFALTNFPMYAAFERTFLKLHQHVTKPQPRKKLDSRQGSIAKQAAPENRRADRAASEGGSIV